MSLNNMPKTPEGKSPGDNPGIIEKIAVTRIRGAIDHGLRKGGAIDKEGRLELTLAQIEQASTEMFYDPKVKLAREAEQKMVQEKERYALFRSILEDKGFLRHEVRSYTVIKVEQAPSPAPPNEQHWIVYVSGPWEPNRVYHTSPPKEDPPDIGKYDALSMTRPSEEINQRPMCIPRDTRPEGQDRFFVVRLHGYHFISEDRRGAKHKDAKASRIATDSEMMQAARAFAELIRHRKELEKIRNANDKKMNYGNSRRQYTDDDIIGELKYHNPYEASMYAMVLGQHRITQDQLLDDTRWHNDQWVGIPQIK